MIGAMKLYYDIQKNRNHHMQSMLHKIIFAFGIRPFVQRKGNQYKGVVDKWYV